MGEEFYSALQLQKQKNPSSVLDTIILVGKIFEACIKNSNKKPDFYPFALKARKISKKILQESVQKASHIFQSEEPAYCHFYTTCNQLISLLLSSPQETHQDMVETLSNTIQAILENNNSPEPIPLEKWQSFIATKILDAERIFQEEVSTPLLASTKEKLRNLQPLNNTQDASLLIETIQETALDTMARIQRSFGLSLMLKKLSELKRIIGFAKFLNLLEFTENLLKEIDQVEKGVPEILSACSSQNRLIEEIELKYISLQDLCRNIECRIDSTLSDLARTVPLTLRSPPTISPDLARLISTFITTSLPSLIKRMLREGKKTKEVLGKGDFCYKMKCRESQSSQPGIDIFLLVPYKEGGQKLVSLRFYLFRNSQLCQEEIDVYQKVKNKRYSYLFSTERTMWEKLLNRNVPNILPITGKTRNGIITPWLPQGSLSCILRSSDTTFPIEDAVKLGIQVTTTLEAMHKERFIHLDIKPCNILLGEDGFIKVIDFGHTLPIKMSPTAFGWASRPYTPPEQFQHPWEASPSMDIWSFGILLFDITHGLDENPFLKNQHPEEDFDTPSKYAEIQRTWEENHALLIFSLDQSNPLDKLIGEFLQYLPSSRPTATEAKEKLELILANID
jgi:hypothetical protein